MSESSRRVRNIVFGVLTAFFIVLTLWYFFTTKAVVAVSDQSGQIQGQSGPRVLSVETSDFKIEAPWYIFYESEGERPVIFLSRENHPQSGFETNPDWGWIEISKSGTFRVRALSNKELRLAVMKNPSQPNATSVPRHNARG